jgi:hypothetical protein
MADDFLLSAPDRGKTAATAATGDDLTPAAPTPEAGALTNAPDESFLSGTAKNVATTALKGVSHVPGFFGDMVEVAKLGEAGIRSLPPGARGWREILAEINAQQEAKREAGDFQPMTGEEIYQRYVKPHVGEYTPTTALGRFGRAAGEGAIPSVLTGGMGLVKGATTGATAGLAGQGMAEITDNPYAVLGASIVGAGVPKAVTTAARWAVPPRLTEQQARIEAGKRISDWTEDPAAAERTMASRADLPDEPLAEATLDKRQARAHGAIMTAGRPELVEPMETRRTAQNAATEGALKALAPGDADPAAVSTGFLKHLDDLGEARDQAMAKLPQGLPANEGGAGLRAVTASEGKRFRGMLDKLKATVDPDGTLRTWTADLAGYARDAVVDWKARPYKARSPIADEIYDIAGKIPDALRFGDLVDFDQALTAAMKKASASGDTAGYNLVRDLKGEVKKALGNTIDEQHQAQQVAVARGEMPKESTLAANIENLGRLADPDAGVRAAGIDATGQRQPSPAGPVRAGPGGVDDAGPAGVLPPVRDAANAPPPGPGGPGAAGGAGGLPPDGGDAAARLRLFNKGWGQYQDVYRKGEVGRALEREGGPGAGYATPDADVAGRAFASGPKGYENAQMWLRAGGDEGLAKLKDVVYGRLQSDLKGKPLDSKTLNTWRGKYGDALRAIDEAEPGFSRQFDGIAGAQDAVTAFEKGAAAKFLRLEHPDDIVNTVGRMMKQEDSAHAIGTLVQQAESLPDGGAVVAGLRKAGATWLENTFRMGGEMLPGMPGGTALTPVFRGTGLKGYIDTHRNMLAALFEPEAVDQMSKVADGIQRSTVVRTLQTRQHNSLTAAREQDVKALQAQMTLALAKDAKEHTMSTVAAFATMATLQETGAAIMGAGSMSRAAGTAIMLGLSKAWQSARERAGLRAVANEADIMKLVAQGFASRALSRALMLEAISEHGIPNQRAFDAVANALAGIEASQQREQERPGRAEGGRVRDMAGMVDKMLSAVRHAHKERVEDTKPLLEAQDDLIAKALAIAGKSGGV